MATALRHDVDSILRTYDFADRGLERSLEGTMLQLDMMDGHDEDARQRIARRRALTDKVGARLFGDVEQEAILAARQATGATYATAATDGEAYRHEAGQALLRSLRALPFDSVANELRESKADFGYISEGLILGDLRGRLQPLLEQRGAAELSTARDLLRYRYEFLYTVPLVTAFSAAYDSVLAGRTIATKPDIWAARDVVFDSTAGLNEIRIGIWDSGLDTALFSRQLLRDATGAPRLIGFDQFLRERNTPLAELPPSLLARQDEMNTLFRGMSDLDGNVDSPDADRARARLASLPADSTIQFWEEVDQWNGYSHGTAVRRYPSPAARPHSARSMASRAFPIRRDSASIAAATMEPAPQARGSRSTACSASVRREARGQPFAVRLGRPSHFATSRAAIATFASITPTTIAAAFAHHDFAATARTAVGAFVVGGLAAVAADIVSASVASAAGIVSTATVSATKVAGGGGADRHRRHEEGDQNRAHHLLHVSHLPIKK